MIEISSKGSFKNTVNFLKGISKKDLLGLLNEYGQKGVNALSEATPKRTGTTAKSWSYIIESSRGSATIAWTNSNMSGDTPVVLLLEYGHGTRGGAYIQGRHFIEPTVLPILDELAEQLWKEVSS